MSNKEVNNELAILLAAEREFIDKGFEGARTTAIAQAAGVTHAMLHYYFRTKEALFARILEDKITLITTEMDAAFAYHAPSMVERLTEVTRRHFDLLVKNPDLPMFAFREVSRRPEAMVMWTDKIKGFLNHIVTDVRPQFEAEVREGLIANVPFVDLLFDMLALNVTSVAAAAMLERVAGVDREEFLRRRREENVEMLKSRLRP